VVLLRAVPSADPAASGPDARLVEAARVGERWAAEALVRRHARGLNGLALRLLGRDVDVDDVVQDAFVSAFGALERLKDPQAFEAWLREILVRIVGKLIRRRRMLARLGMGRASLDIDLDALIGPGVPQDDALELRRVYALAQRLPAQVRVPLLLQRVEGLGLAEIARLTGTSQATVKRRVAAGEAALRETFLRGDAR
jgi:RNA polymerase sigma-70 factor (ECF subfamily)